jgi:hypothetical protein
MNHKTAGLILIFIGLLIAALTHYGKAYAVTEDEFIGKTKHASIN